MPTLPNPFRPVRRVAQTLIMRVTLARRQRLVFMHDSGESGARVRLTGKSRPLDHLGAFRETGLLMGAVAKGLVFGSAAAAQRDAIAHLARLPIGPYHGNAATGPNRPVRREGNLFGKVDLHRITSRCERIGKRPRGTLVNHFHDLSPHVGIRTILCHLPHIGDCADAKPCVNAE